MSTPTTDTAVDQRELELVRQAIAGDTASLETLLVDRHDQLLAHVERKMPAGLRSSLSADDILQQAYLNAFKAIGRFEPRGPGSFYGWVKVIADRKLMDAWKAKKVTQQAPAAKPAGGESSYFDLLCMVANESLGPGGKAMVSELQGAFHVALTRLPSNYREAIEMRYLQELPLEEVASRLETTEGSARGLCHRARQCLREEMMRLSRFV